MKNMSFVHKTSKFDILYNITSFWGDIMEKIKKGDKVERISHGKDIIFEVIKITKEKNVFQIN